MTVDPKFANIPWIACGEPDVYESEDLPESDRWHNDPKEDEQILPKEIEKINISAFEARKRFEHCKVDASNVDFSDNITGDPKVGYSVESSEYEMTADGTREATLTARFQRLQTEVRQLLDDTETVKKEAGTSSVEAELSADQITALAQSLTEQLGQLQLEEIFGPHSDLSDLCAHDAIVQKRLLEQITNFNPRVNKPGRPSDDHITFDIYSKPSATSHLSDEKMLELDRRLQRLEALLGSGRPEASVGLLETAARVSDRLGLLQPPHLDQVEARLATLQAKLESLAKPTDSKIIADTDAQNKISELYTLVTKWNSFSSELPIIVDRLRDLQTLHEQAADFSSSLMNIDTIQKKIESDLTTYGKLLVQVQESLGDALSTFKENVTTLQQTMKSVAS